MRRLSVLVASIVLLVPVRAEAVYSVDTLTVNRWRMPVTDFGPFGQGASWRVPTHTYLFGCGPWVGALSGADTLVSVGYNPNSGGSEMSPGDSLGGEEDPDVRVYVSSKDWPPPLSRFPHSPQTIRADEDLWACFNDCKDSAHVPPGRPLDVQVYLSGYEWSHWSAQDMVFLQYEIENQSADTLRAAYFGVVLDYDIGGATDDMYDALYHEWVSGLGGDSVYADHLAIGYDYNNMEPGWDSVGAFGVRVLRSPGAELVSAMKKFTIDFDPLTDPAQYLTLAGYDYRTGEYDPFDTTDGAPADKRFLLATGPFDVVPGQLDTLVVVICGSTEWPDRYGLARLAEKAESIWTNGRPGVAEGKPESGPARLRAWPNPFRTGVSLRTADSRAGFSIYSASGRLVANVGQGPGFWNGRDFTGLTVPAGVYLCRCGENSLKLVKQE